MKMKLISKFPIAAALAWLCALSSQAAQPTITLDVSDSHITVGESFSVGVRAHAELSAGDLTAFGFDVDPNGTLTLLSYDTHTIGPDYADVSVALNEVVGEYNGIGNAGQNVLLASLGFTALSAGPENLLIQGVFDGLFKGGYYENLDADIVGSLALEVHEPGLPGIPDSGFSLVLLSLGLLGMGALRPQ